MKFHRCHRPSAGHIAAWILLGLAAIALFPYVVQLLWNHVLVDVVPAVSAISYWQALGLLVLCKLLFGGCPGGGKGRCHCGGRGRCGRDRNDDDDTDDKWIPGGRENFRREMRRHFKGEDDSPAQPGA